MAQSMTIHLRVWRQPGPGQEGRLVPYTVKNASPDMSFLELLDLLNEDLVAQGQDPIEFDSDCREGICGSCGAVVNGQAHGTQQGSALCQLHMRHFKDGDTIVVEPWRAKAFPIIRDLVVDRSAFDRIIAAGGYVSVNTGQAPDANAVTVPGKMPSWRWTLPPASVAVPVSPPVQTHRRPSSPRPRSASSLCCRRGTPNGNGGSSEWFAKWTSRISVTARTTPSARLSVPRKSPSATSPG